MSRFGLLLAPLLFAMSCQSSAAEDELCSKLRAFQTAPFEKDAQGKPLRRAIELHWVGHWLDFEHGFGKECHTGGTAPGKLLCAWLPQNTSTEFASLVPMEILGCYGWQIPAYPTDWYIRQGSVRIETDEKGNHLEDSDRYMLLEMDMRSRKAGHMAIRLSVIPWKENFLDPEPKLKIDEPVDTETEDRFP